MSHKHTGSQPLTWSRNSRSYCLLIENPVYLRIRKQSLLDTEKKKNQLKIETEKAFLDWREHHQNMTVTGFFTLRLVLPDCWNHLSDKQSLSSEQQWQETSAQEKSNQHLHLAVSGKSPSVPQEQTWAASEDFSLELVLLPFSSLDVVSLLKKK